MQHFARDVQGEILGIHDPAQKTQPGWQKAACIVGYKDPVYVELHVAFAFRLEQIERLGGGNVEQVDVTHHAFHAIVDRHPGFIEGVGDMMIKFLVLLLVDFLRLPGPDRRGFVQGLVAEFDRKADVIGIGLDDVADAGFFKEFLGVLLDVERHSRTALRSF